MDPFTAATTPTVTPLPLEESPTQLDLTLGAPIPREAQAFSAYSALHEQKKAGLPLDPIAVKEWTTYRDTAKAYNRPLFPSKTAPIQRENAKQIDNLLSGLDTVPTLLPEPQAKAMQAHINAFPEAERPNAAARAVNYSLLQQATGKPIRPDTYDSFRDTYAKQILKLDKTDDLSVYTELKRRNDLKKDADKELAADFEQLASDALAGKPIDIAAHEKKYTEYFGEELGQAAALELRQRTRQARTLGKSIKPLAEELRAFILHDGGREDLITDPAQLDRVKYTNAELMANKLKNLTPIQKDAIRIYLGETGQALGQDPAGTAERAGEAFNRGIENQLAGGIASFLARASQVPGNIVNTIAGNDRNTERTAELDNFLTSFAFLKDKTNKIGSLANPSESWASASVIAAAEQLPYMIAASAGGAGLVATGMSMAGQSYESARLRNPEGNDSTQFLAATLSGASQAVIERAAVKVTGRALGALPIFKSTFGAKFGTEGFLKLARIQSPLLRAAAGGAIGAAAVGATEYAEEIAQDSVDRLLQDIVSIPTGVTDDNGKSSTLYKNLANTFASWDPRQEKGAKMLLSLMPFILIGAGGGSFSSFQNGVQLQRNAAVMRTLGVPEPIIQEIISTPDVKRADTLLQQAVQTELIEHEKANAEKHASALAEYIDTITSAWRSQGIEILEPEFDDEGNVTAHTLALPTGPRQFATEEEAMQALIDYNREQGEMLLDEGLEAITAETIDHFFQPGQRAAEGDTTVRERDFEGTFANLLENKLASAAQLKDRLTAYAMQEGITIAQASKQANAGTLKVKARNFAEQVNRGSWRYVVELFKGADPVSAIEDFAEAYWKAGVNEGILQPDRAVSWIRQMEDATGNDYLPADFTFTPQADNIAFWEALGQASKEYALHHYRHQDMPSAFKRWVETMLTALGTAWEWFKTLSRGQTLQDAITDGKIDKQFIRMISDSVGLNEQARAERVQKREEENTLAEMLEDLPKLSERIKGKLLHPARATAANHPEAGELRRIYDGLTKTVKLRKKYGQQYEKNSVIKAEQFFAPRNENINLDQLRQTLVSEGFQFDNIAEMLTAIEDSIFYGRESYATHSGLGVQNASFSLSTTSSQSIPSDLDGNATMQNMEQGENKNATSEDLDYLAAVEAGDMATAQKMVEQSAENSGFHIKAYHGTTRGKFNFFDKDKQRRGNVTAAGYFTKNKRAAIGYASSGGAAFALKDEREKLKKDNRFTYDPTVISVFLKGEFIDGDKMKIDIAKLEQAIQKEYPETDINTKLEEITGITEGSYFSDEEGDFIDGWILPDSPKRKNSGDEGFGSFEEALSEYINNLDEFEHFAGNDTEAFGEYSVLSFLFSDPFIGNAYIESLNVDGIKYTDKEIENAFDPKGTRNNETIIVLNPNAIKSADPVTYDDQGNIIPLSQRFDSNKESISFSLSRDSQNNLQTILEARMSRGPIERTKILETMRERLQSLVFRLENRATGALTPMEKQLQGWRGKDLTEAQTERLRIEDAIAAVKGIVGALPAELRARVSIPLTRILDADSDLKSQNAFKELIQRADNVIEEHLQELYTERIGDLLDLARPTATEARTNKTLLTPDTQSAIDQIADIVVSSPTDLLTREAAIEAQLLNLQEQIEAATDEDTARELTRQQIALQLTLGDIVTFGNLSQQSASELAQAYETLRTIYVRGRVIRKALIDAEREKIHANRADLMHAMNKPDGVTGPEHDRATKAGFVKNTIATLKSFAIEHMNVHQALEIIFPNTITVQQWGDRLIRAMRGTNRRKLAANARYEAFMRERLDATNNRQRGKILAALADRRTHTDIRIAEIDAMKTEVIPIDYVQKILNGQMTVSYSGDKYAMTQIRQAWRDYLLLPKKKRARTESLKIQVVKSRKKPQSLFMSDLEMLDVLMTAQQESYAPTMDKYGYTEEVLEQIRAAIDPRALAIGEFLRSEYDANWSQMNPVFQRIFHMNMPNTRNYAPGTFHTSAQVKEMQNELGQAGTASAMSAGSTKNRRAHMARPKTMNALAKYFAHVEQTSYWIEYAELVKEIAQTVRHSELFRALDVRHGAAVKTNVNQWIDRLNVDGAHAANEKLTTDDLVNRVMSGQSHLGLAWNLSVPFKQFSAAFGSLTMEDPKEALISFSKILHSWPDMKKIFQSEAIQQRLKQGFSPETRSLLDASKLNPSQLLDLLHMGHMPAGFADAAFSTISGFVSYDITLRRELARDGRTPEQAEKIALERMDTVLAKTTQPVDTQMKSLAELRNAQGIGRLLFMFKSDPRRAIGIILSTAWQYKRGDATKADLAKVLLTQWVFYGLLGSIGTALFKSIAHDDDDDENYWDWQHLILGSLLGPVAGVALFGTLAETALKTAFGAKKFSTTANPLDAVFSKGINAAFSDDEFTLKDANSIGQIIGMAGSLAGRPELVLLPALIRGTMQLANAADNLVESDTEQRTRLLREHAESLKTQQDQLKDTYDQTVSKALATTDPNKRNEILSTLDEKTRAKARTAIDKKERQANMTPDEITLLNMSKTRRQDAVEFVFNNLTEPDKTAYALRMKDLFDIDLIPNQE